MVVCKDDARPGQREVVRRNVRREFVGSKAVPHEYYNSSPSRSRLLLLRLQNSRHSEEHEEESTQENEQPYCHGSPPGQ
jgi:hypothetical protein